MEPTSGVQATGGATAGGVGNAYDKYGTRNPVSRALMRRFLAAAGELYAAVQPSTVLEVGTGEGQLAQHLLGAAQRPARFVASDVSLERVASNLDPLLEFRQASAYALPFDDRSFDLVVCCEVLEHLDEPERALAEVARVASRAVLLSTPWEPVWRVLNLARGAYWRSLGNTPGHVQHFGRGALRRLAQKQLTIVEMRRPLPWTVLLGRPRRSA